MWFLGQHESFIDEVVLVPVDDKTLSIHSMKDGSLMTEIKVEDEIYRSASIDGFGFIVSTKNGKVVLAKLIS